MPDVEKKFPEAIRPFNIFEINEFLSIYISPKHTVYFWRLATEVILFFYCAKFIRHTAPNERDVKACDEIYVSDFTAPIIRVMMRRKNRLTS
ncbi:unnamed protein product [Rhizophagus irregularis]|nr:unnamed protein product [Rhizophagus irregularis]